MAKTPWGDQLDVMLGKKKSAYSPSNPAPYGQGAGVLLPEYGGGVNIARSTTTKVSPGGTRNLNDTTPPPGGAPGGGGRGLGDAQARANASAKMSARKQNEATSALVDQQRGLIDAFGTQRDAKLQNILNAFNNSDSLLLQNYGTALGGLLGNKGQNEMAEADSTFGNIANAVRERAALADQAASQGAGETDLLRAQLQALRNYSANQGEINRAFSDTQQSINNSIGSLNSDTASSRTNLFNQAEADRESAWANYANQTADAWTQIMNIESANTNIDSDTSEAYTRKFGDAGQQAAAAVRNTYSRQAIPQGWTDWSGKGQKEERALTSSNRAAAVNLGGPLRRPEGATLRKWE